VIPIFFNGIAGGKALFVSRYYSATEASSAVFKFDDTTFDIEYGRFLVGFGTPIRH